MKPGKINLREMGCEQMGSGQIGHAEINALRNEFLLSIFKIAQRYFISKYVRCLLDNPINCRL